MVNKPNSILVRKGSTTKGVAGVWTPKTFVDVTFIDTSSHSRQVVTREGKTVPRASMWAGNIARTCMQTMRYMAMFWNWWISKISRQCFMTVSKK